MSEESRSRLDMTGRVALITGAGRRRGIGAGAAGALAAAGCTVIISDVKADGPEDDGLEIVAKHLTSEGGSVYPMFADLTSPSEISTLVSQVVEEHGRVDVLVNNAAARHGTDRGDPAGVALEDLDMQLTVNVRAAFLLIQAVIPAMRAQEHGRIINISSQAARIGTTGRAVYSTTKAALLGMSRSLAVDLGPDGITVNAVCPGAIATDRLVDTVSNETPDGAPEASEVDLDGRMEKWAATIPAGRLGRARDIGDAVLFLSSDEAAYVNGHAFAVDGGRFAI
jgi:3-oxoacyl-[acyl-carrier protein] reductase